MKSNQNNRIGSNSESASELPSPSLEEVRKVFSAKTLTSNPYISLYYFFRDLAIFGLLTAAIWQIDKIYLLIPLWILLGFNTLGLYQYGHEAAHRSLFKSPLISWIVGQIAFLPALHPYSKWVFGHNHIHHNNTVRLKGDLAWHPRSPERYSKMSVFDRFMHRIYWSRFGAGIYYLNKMWLQGLILYDADFPGAKRDTRLVLIFGFISISAVIYFSGSSADDFSWQNGLWMFTKLQFIPFIVLNYMIGITVYIQHIHPDIAWKPESEWSEYYGQMKGTINYNLPKIINFFLHNIFLHAPHHVDPRIPFYNLHRAMDELRRVYAGDLAEGNNPVRDYFSSTQQCKLYDSENQQWVDYPK